jgi:hypothetical protein
MNFNFWTRNIAPEISKTTEDEATICCNCEHYRKSNSHMCHAECVKNYTSRLDFVYGEVRTYKDCVDVNTSGNCKDYKKTSGMFVTHPGPG